MDFSVVNPMAASGALATPAAAVNPLATAAGAGAGAARGASLSFTTKLSPKEWAALQAAIAKTPALEAVCLGEDGKVGVPRGWSTIAGGGKGFVKGGVTLESIGQVVEVELGALAGGAGEVEL